MLRFSEKFDVEAELHPDKLRQQYILSVLNIVQNILNTSQNTASIDLSLGMPSFDMHGSIHEPSKQKKLLTFIENHLPTVDKRIQSFSCELEVNQDVTEIMVFSVQLRLQGEVEASLLVKLLADGTFEVAQV